MPALWHVFLNGLTEDKVTVKLLGGDLFIEYNRDENTVYMTGPARITFTGSLITNFGVTLKL